MKQLKKIPRYAILVIFAAIAVTPFLWLLGTSLKGSEELFTYPPTIIPNSLFSRIIRVCGMRCPSACTILTAL